MRRLVNRLMLFAGAFIFLFPFLIFGTTRDVGGRPQISYWGQWKSGPVESIVFGILQQVYNVGGWFAFYSLHLAWLVTGIMLISFSMWRTKREADAQHLRRH